MKGLNDMEINDFVLWTKQASIEIRFIEFMPFDGNKWTSNKMFSFDEKWRSGTSIYHELYLGEKKGTWRSAFKAF